MVRPMKSKQLSIWEQPAKKNVVLEPAEKLLEPRRMLVGNVVDAVLQSRLCQWSLALVERLEDSGLTVTISEAGCSVAPADKVTDEIRRDLAFAKPYLLEFQKWQQARSASTAVPGPAAAAGAASVTTATGTPRSASST